MPLISEVQNTPPPQPTTSSGHQITTAYLKKLFGLKEKSVYLQLAELNDAQLAALDADARNAVFEPYRNPDYILSPHPCDHVPPWRECRTVTIHPGGGNDLILHLEAGRAFSDKEKAALQKLEEEFAVAFDGYENLSNPAHYQAEIDAIAREGKGTAEERAAKMDALRTKIQNCPEYKKDYDLRMREIEVKFVPAALRVAKGVVRLILEELEQVTTFSPSSVYHRFGLNAENVRDCLLFPLRSMADSAWAVVEQLQNISLNKDAPQRTRGKLERAGVIELRAPNYH